MFILLMYPSFDASERKIAAFDQAALGPFAATWTAYSVPENGIVHPPTAVGSQRPASIHGLGAVPRLL